MFTRALVLLLVSVLPALAVEKVQCTAVAYQSDTNVIRTTYRVGEAFDVAILVRDLRPVGYFLTPSGVVKLKVRGVYAAFVDLAVDSSVAALTGGVKFGDGFQNDRRLVMRPDFIDDAGGFTSSMNGTGTANQELIRFRVKCVAPGTVTFAPSFANLELPRSMLLVFGNDNAVPPEESPVGSTDVKIVPVVVKVVP